MLWSRVTLTLLTLQCVLADNISSIVDRRIYKGYVGAIEHYPYAVFLHFDKTNPKSCGASLISTQAVVTAAHCMDELRYRKGSIRARFGSTVPIYSKIVINVVDYEINPRYNEENGANNIAVAFLEKPVPLQHTVKKIPFATKLPPDGQMLWTAGWGYQIVGPRYKAALSYYRSLHSTSQELLDPRAAKEYIGIRTFQSSVYTYYIKGEHAKDDAGNGLILKEPNELLVGVFSHVIDSISVYTSVVYHHIWIGQALEKLYKRVCKDCDKKGKNI